MIVPSYRGLDSLLTGSRWGDVSTVTLVVGETQTPFQVHEADLFTSSPVFKAAFSPTFKEGSDRKMTLPDEDAELFNLLVEWLYTHNYNIPQRTGDKSKDAGRFMEPVRLYVLADKYGVTSLKNLIAKNIFDAMKQHGMTDVDVDTVAYVYQNVPGISGIRKLLADFYACYIYPDWYETTKTRECLQNNPEFAADVMLRLDQHTSKDLMRNLFKCGMVGAYLEEE